MLGVVAGSGTVAVSNGRATVGIFGEGGGTGGGEVVDGDEADFGIGDAVAAGYGELGSVCNMAEAEGEAGCEEVG